jgi:hypothetical protein
LLNLIYKYVIMIVMRAQGALEYLIIIAAVLGVSAIVVLFIGGALSSTTSSASTTLCQQAAANCALRIAIGGVCYECKTACVNPATKQDIFPGACYLCEKGLIQSIVSGRKINVLEVYPCGPVLSMILAGYPNLEVTPVLTDDFNQPGFDISKYNVIVFGFADWYDSKSLTLDASNKVRQFVADGGGIIATHDTDCCCSQAMQYLRDVFGTKCGTHWDSYSTIYKARSGNITEYPFMLPDTMTVQPTHLSMQEYTTATVWYNTSVNDPAVYFLVTNYYGKGKAAFIQSGHGIYPGPTCPSPRPAPVLPPLDEQKLLINTLVWFGT